MTEKKKRVLDFGLLLGWFILLALVFTRPLAAKISEYAAGQIGDNVYFIWMVGWMQKALFQLRTNPFDVWFLNYPEGWNMASTEIAPAQLALSMPFSLLGGEVLGYNVAHLLSFLLSGMIMAYWVRHLTGSAAAGLVSGTIFACIPYRQVHFLAGHLNLAGTQWIPLFFWGWFDLVRPTSSKTARTPWKPAVMAALGLGLTALCSQYYVFMLIVVVGFQTFAMLLFQQGRALFHSRRFWTQIFRFMLVALPFLLVAELPFLLFARAGGMPARDWGSVRMYSAGLSDFLLPSTTHFLWGKWVGAHFNRDIWIEATLYVGLVTLFLFLMGWAKRKQDDVQRWIWQWLMVGTVIAVVFAMGTDLHWNGQAVSLNIPAFLQSIVKKAEIPILLPSYFLFRWFPFFDKLRALMRFGVFAHILLACGAGLGFAFLQQHISRKTWLTLGVIALILIDFLPRAQADFVRVAPRPVDYWLAQQPAQGSVMRIPFELNDDQQGVYESLYFEKPFIGGFFNAFPPNQYRSIRELMSHFPDEASIAKARALRVRWVILETKEISPEESTWYQEQFNEMGLILVQTFENGMVYELGDKN